jgi:hypothetical protein
MTKINYVGLISKAANATQRATLEGERPRKPHEMLAAKIARSAYPCHNPFTGSWKLPPL